MARKKKGKAAAKVRKAAVKVELPAAKPRGLRAYAIGLLPPFAVMTVAGFTFYAVQYNLFLVYMLAAFWLGWRSWTTLRLPLLKVAAATVAAAALDVLIRFPFELPVLQELSTTGGFQLDTFVLAFYLLGSIALWSVLTLVPSLLGFFGAKIMKK